MTTLVDDNTKTAAGRTPINSGDNQSNCKINKNRRTLVNDYAKNSSKYNNGMTSIDDDAKSSRYRNRRTPINSNSIRVIAILTKIGGLQSMAMQK